MHQRAKHGAALVGRRLPLGGGLRPPSLRFETAPAASTRATEGRRLSPRSTALGSCLRLARNLQLEDRPELRKLVLDPLQ
jgi:hypothetical protein